MKNSSIYEQFSKKLIIATSLFILIISFMFYGFTKATLYEEITDNLLRKANIIQQASINTVINHENLQLITEDKLTVDLVKVQGLRDISFREYHQNGTHFIELLYPFELSKETFIKITKNIDNTDDMLRKIFSNVFILSLGGLVMVVIYALAVSKNLLAPILNITKRLSNMNENSLTRIETTTLPIEFHPLANSINALTKKIEMYVKYQKELFIGAAHELKTPLAVMKLKSEVILLKPREQEKYEETLRLFISEINGMDKMVSSILDVGRQEGAQFEKPTEIDVVKFIENRVNNYRLLAGEKKIHIEFVCDIEKFITIIQPTLLNQIIQNFIQNAIKFTPNEKTITVKIYKTDPLVVVEVRDEGVGVDENIDLFAPFKRIGKEQGAGLGLFLAKSATDAIGGEISILNRQDGVTGSVATLKLQTNPTCKLK
ncbi:MAG: HAMP domain-containing sensor histidine kinase [Arcobacteraceae bacterium]|jgi:two-component system OmpR family sensor kinase|nr:HAMP domain-containing sensor histidine kinase [Arcobacteraceae bacterium]